MDLTGRVQPVGRCRPLARQYAVVAQDAELAIEPEQARSRGRVGNRPASRAGGAAREEHVVVDCEHPCHVEADRQRRAEMHAAGRCDDQQVARLVERRRQRGRLLRQACARAPARDVQTLADPLGLQRMQAALCSEARERVAGSIDDAPDDAGLGGGAGGTGVVESQAAVDVGDEPDPPVLEPAGAGDERQHCTDHPGASEDVLRRAYHRCCRTVGRAARFNPPAAPRSGSGRPRRLRRPGARTARRAHARRRRRARRHRRGPRRRGARRRTSRRRGRALR